MNLEGVWPSMEGRFRDKDVMSAKNAILYMLRVLPEEKPRNHFFFLYSSIAILDILKFTFPNTHNFCENVNIR